MQQIVVTRTSADGNRTISEIEFAGKKQTIVLDESTRAMNVSK